MPAENITATPSVDPIEKEQRKERVTRVKELVEIIRADSSEESRNSAFKEIMTVYNDKIYGLVYSMVQNHEDAKDIVSEVFAKAYQKLPGFRGDSSFYTWLYSIARNHTLNFIQTQRREEHVSLDEPLFEEGGPTLAHRIPSTTHSTTAEVQAHELSVTIADALDRLVPKHREIIDLKAEGKSHAEMAEILRIPAGTVRSRLSYAMGILSNFIPGLSRKLKKKK